MWAGKGRVGGPLACDITAQAGGEGPPGTQERDRLLVKDAVGLPRCDRDRGSSGRPSEEEAGSSVQAWMPRHTRAGRAGGRGHPLRAGVGAGGRGIPGVTEVTLAERGGVGCSDLTHSCAF